MYSCNSELIQTDISRTCCIITIPIVNVPRETELILSGKNMSFSGDYFQIQIKDYIAM